MITVLSPPDVGKTLLVFMYHVDKHGRTVVIGVSGEIDVLTTESFREAIVSNERDAERIVVSLLDCTYLDSTGLTVLIASQRRLGDRFTVVVGDSGNVRKIIEIASLAQFLRIVPSVEAALAVTA